MKKTPADFASTPAAKALNAIVAVSALTGIIGAMTPKAQAADETQPAYNPSSQKSVGVNGLDMITYTTVATGSTLFQSQEDSKTTSDQF
jgi:hypothetical protein